MLIRPLTWYEAHWFYISIPNNGSIQNAKIGAGRGRKSESTQYKASMSTIVFRGFIFRQWSIKQQFTAQIHYYKSWECRDWKNKYTKSGKRKDIRKLLLYPKDAWTKATGGVMGNMNQIWKTLSI